ncbi:MAG: hypothetical protein HOP97_09410 [Terrabacter sp.]|nr:hypothetical protein [Terrabacter sp.]
MGVLTIRSAPDRPRTDARTTTVRRRKPHRLRWWLAGLAALLLAVHAAGGWYFAGRIASQALAATPGTMTRAHDDVRVTAGDGDRVTLARGVDATSNFDAPASYGMAWDGGAGHLGPPTVNADGTVTRTLEVVTGVAAPPPAPRPSSCTARTRRVSAVGGRRADVPQSGVSRPDPPGAGRLPDGADRVTH